ncbi:hypothetical protein HHI36_004687 [Cryptolaemus montrouzieri]|uniref:Probable RNA polymerase II nuclear localization protein SLC7A6OS n=1 Tax=Cryptolaemus montrouzieri TaxID=559131 RepID=A0ABD2NRZ4_9CUCU
METLIRLKRSLDDSPSDTLILNCNKKRKLDVSTNESDEVLLAVLKFTGTQISQDEDIHKHIANFKNCSKSSCNFKRHNVDLSNKLRLAAKENSKNSRYKVINCLRSNLETETKENDGLTIYDLELEHNSRPDQKFVFDLYYSNTNVLDEVDDYNISIYPTLDSLVFDSDEVYNNIDEENDDSDDSNAEDNWKNDYPDESDVESVNENDMIEAMKNMDMNDILSSEDELVYCAENKEDYEYEVDELDKKKYGTMYAKFRAKYNDDEEIEENDLMSDMSENDDY